MCQHYNNILKFFKYIVVYTFLLVLMTDLLSFCQNSSFNVVPENEKNLSYAHIVTS